MALHSNRLAQESSPYLLQHAHNPVDWYPWGPDAFEAARSQNKPIFLSVGYSTCYWCHVMERQCFENESIAAVMNELFVNIKVDREERPDVDQLYMMAVQVVARQGGWPMSVFLTPDLRPFYGGTYFPPTDAHGRPGFPTLLQAISDAWNNRRGEVDSSANQISEILGRIAQPPGSQNSITIDDVFIESLIDRSIADFEPRFGGFGNAPKFPRETLLELLLAHNRHSPSAKRMAKLLFTLDAMAAGGIRDHLGGGFHRYSTDARWLVPHFEIMLYDQAMLAWVYTEAYAQTEDLKYARVARGILDFVLREMTSPQGAFFTAIDAEVDAQEGMPYLWTEDEINRILGPDDARVFSHVYGVDLGPNFADPHHGSGEPEKNVLYLPQPIEQAAQELKMEAGDLEAKLEPMRQKLHAARRERKQPILDTKIITSWNGLMIRAFAHAGNVLQERRYLDAAGDAADFLLRHHRGDDGTLYRTSRDGAAKVAGFLDDYAFLAQGLIALEGEGGREKRRDQAGELAVMMRRRFLDDLSGGFFFTDAGASDLIVRQKTASDSPLPSGNAVAAMLMVELGQMEIAHDTLAAFADQLEAQAEGMSPMVQAAMVHLRKSGQPITIEPMPAADEGRETPQTIAAGVVRVRAAWADGARLNVHLDILDGFHINAHDASDGLLATEINVNGEDAAEIEAIEYPPGLKRRFAFAEDAIRVYEGSVTIAVRFRKSMIGEKPVKLSVFYQACNESACLPGVTKTLDVVTL